MMNAGLIAGFIGSIILLWYEYKTDGCTGRVDRDRLVSPCWHWSGYIILAVGFLFQVIGNVLGL